MSFARAKRFNYKEPDLDVSPADYYISSAFEKGVSISKCPRFQDKKNKDGENSSSLCYRRSCYHEHPQPSKSCHEKCNNVSRIETVNEDITHLRRNDSMRASVKARPNITKTASAQRSSETINEKTMDIRGNEAMKTFVREKPSINKITIAQRSSMANTNYINNVPSNLGTLAKVFSESEEFIDDDYHSFTSSEELNHLKGVQEFEYNEVYNAYKKLVISTPHSQSTTNKHFENLILQKMGKIELTLEQFKQDLSKLDEKLQIDKLKKSHDIERLKMENMKKYFETQMSRFSKEKRTEIGDIITRAIKNLTREFESKRSWILQNNEKKIQKLIEEMYATSNSSTKEIQRLCADTATHLTKRLVNILDNVNLPIMDNLTKHCDFMVEEVKESCNNDCFNYENICKILSEHLQLTQEEKDALEEDNWDMTLRYGDTQQALEAQASVIDLLQSEIGVLKQHIHQNKE